MLSFGKKVRIHILLVGLGISWAGNVIMIHDDITSPDSAYQTF